MSLTTFITENHLKEHFRTTKTFEIAVFRPSITEACEKYLYPALSQEFAQSIIDGAESETTVVDLTRGALLCFASELYFNMGGINVTADGFSENVTDDQKPTRLELISIAQESRAAAGHIKMDLLLKYLESNTDAEKFTLWKNSEAFTIFKEFPITSTTEFNRFCRIRESRSIFLALRPAMQQAMLLNIQTVLDEAENATFNSINQRTFDVHIKNALANFAYGYGIFDLATTFGFDTILSFSNLNASRQKGYEKIAKDMLVEIESRKFANANASLNQAILLIAANSPAPDVEEVAVYVNREDSRVFNF